MISEILTLVFLALGLFFIVAGSIGLVRMPDVFCRMHATSKATTLGLVFILMASFTHLGVQSVGLKAILAIVFAFLTAPVGAHLISKAAYLSGVKLNDRSITDALSEIHGVLPQKGRVNEPSPQNPS